MIKENNSFNKNKKELIKKKCDIFYISHPYFYDKIDIDQSKYFKYINLNNLIVGDIFGDKIFQYIAYGMYFNLTLFEKLDKLTVPKFFSKNFKVQIKYFEISIDLDNYITPLRSYENYLYDYLNSIKRLNWIFSIFFFSPKIIYFLNLYSFINKNHIDIEKLSKNLGNDG